MLLKVMKAAHTGVYEPRGDVKNGNYAIGQAYGRRTEKGIIIRDDINDQLGYIAAELEIPVFLQVEIALGYTALTGIEPDLTIEDVIYKRFGNYLDCWEVGKQGIMAGIARKLGKEGIVAISHAKQVERFAVQLAYLGAKNIIIPPGLTNDHDPESTQDWTTSGDAWIKREWPGDIILYAIGRPYAKLMLPNKEGPRRANTIE